MRSAKSMFGILVVFLLSTALLMPDYALAAKPDDACPGQSCEAPGKNKTDDGGIDEENEEEAASAPAQGNGNGAGQAGAPGQFMKLIKGNSDVKGNLRTSQHFYYPGDVIEVFIKFSRGWEMLADGTLDAHVVVISPQTEMLVFPVDPEIGPTSRKFFSIELSQWEDPPVGQYQVGLILTLAGGDPINLLDWYNGFRGLMDMEGLYISADPLPEDADMDGECDFDADGDGFCDEESGTDDDDDADDDDADLTDDNL